MFNLIRVNDDCFYTDGPAGSGTVQTKKGIVQEMLSMGVEFQEIEDALVSLIMNQDDVADFGIFKKFIFSKKKGE